MMGPKDIHRAIAAEMQADGIGAEAPVEIDLAVALLADLSLLAQRAFVGGLFDANSAHKLRSRAEVFKWLCHYGFAGQSYHATRFHAVYKAGYDLGVQNAMEIKRREAAKLTT